MVTTKAPLYREHSPLRTRSWVLIGILLATLGAGAWALLTNVSWPARSGLQLWTLVDDASGLQKGTAIELGGIKIGEIEQIALTEEDRVRVVFRIERAHAARMRAPVDAAACRSEEDNACGTRIGLRATPSLSPVASQAGFVVHPAGSRGRGLQNGDFVPSVSPAGLNDLLAILQDKRIVQELPLELRRLLPELRRMTRSVTALSEGLQTKSPVRKLLGADRK